MSYEKVKSISVKGNEIWVTSSCNNDTAGYKRWKFNGDIYDLFKGLKDFLQVNNSNWIWQYRQNEIYKLKESHTEEEFRAKVDEIMRFKPPRGKRYTLSYKACDGESYSVTGVYTRSRVIHYSAYGRGIVMDFYKAKVVSEWGRIKWDIKEV